MKRTNHIQTSRQSTEESSGAKTVQADQAAPHSHDSYILLVDDDPDTQAILSVILELLHWPSQVVSSGAAALSAVAAKPPAMVLLDLMMPDMSGFDVLARLKADPRTRDIPVVIHSAMGNDQRLARLGANRVLPKGSANLETMRQVISDLLSDRL